MTLQQVSKIFSRILFRKHNVIAQTKEMQGNTLHTFGFYFNSQNFPRTFPLPHKWTQIKNAVFKHSLRADMIVKAKLSTSFIRAVHVLNILPMATNERNHLQNPPN